METTLTELSSLTSPTWSAKLNDLSIKQFKRTYSGGYSANFVLPLSGFVSARTQNYSNFYLTARQKASDGFSIPPTSFKSSRTRTYLKFGASYLTWEELSTTYKLATFAPELSEASYFDLTFYDNQICTISTVIDGQLYYLASDDSETVFFIQAYDLNSSNLNEFKYMFDDNYNYLFLFQDKAESFYSLTKTDNIATLSQVNTFNKRNIVANKFVIGKGINVYPDFTLNSSFVTYENDTNTIDPSKSVDDLSNNLLLHNKVSDDDRVTDIIVLKNQMDIRDKISSSNNLLSGEGLYVDNMRKYTSINNTIPSETTSELELNYVFFNTQYTIKSGTNSFVAPSSMYPFNILNINDSKFVDCGAFSFDVPARADKVYRMNKLTQFNNQHYLCTWLSGSPMSTDKVWVDRYYYPDLIDKSSALAGKAIFQPTYQDLIEQLIQNNSTLETSINNIKFFDKISDLVFVPNELYIYDRISKDAFEENDISTQSCELLATSTSNYFRTINESKTITFSFYFTGDKSTWTIKSDRNNINCGVCIEKTDKTVTFSYILYDSSTGGYQTFETTTQFKQFKENYVCFSLDLLTGEGYVYLNNESILDISIPVAQYIQKQILYGDIFYISGGTKTNMSTLASDKINTIRIAGKYTPKNVAFVSTLFDGKIEIDDMQISLPCGMRNNFDNIALLQTICGNDTHKTNRVNVVMKNLNINNSTIVEGLSSSILQNIRKFIPASTVINTISFENFK